MDVEGTVALITGGASGLGEATARELVAAGAQVVVVDCDRERGEALVAELGQAMHFCAADVTDEAEVRVAVELAASLGALRAAVSCAGIATGGRTVSKDGTPHDLAHFSRVVQVNLVGTFNVTRLCAAAMAKNAPDAGGQRGAIVNTASIAAFEGQIGQAAYSASKGGIVGMTLPIARDLAALGIRCNVICPGTMDTALVATLPVAARRSLEATVPFPSRLGVPSEFARLARHLLENDYVNGECVRLDGALRMGPR